MKLTELKAALEARADIADFRISETRKAGSERFFIGAKPDLARSIQALDYKVTVYVDAEEKPSRSRGNATVSVHPTMDARSVEAILDRAVFAASKSRNPWYPIPEPVAAAMALPASGFELRAPEAWMAELGRALYEGEASRGRSSQVAGRVNSLELFLDRIEHRVLNSRGVDAAWSTWRGYVEFTVEAQGSSGGVELTDMFSFAEPDPARLAAEMGARVAAVGDRAIARPTPALAGLPLVLAGRQAEDILRWFFANLDAARVYSKASPFALGASLHGEKARPGEYDPVSLWAEPYLPGAPGSSPYDPEGAPLSRLSCAENGEAKALHGQTRYAHYLGLPPAGAYSLFSVGPGSIPAARMRAEPNLEVAFFSDFNVDADSGDFGGEIRLAYWNDGARRIPVSGGSVTGSLFENRASIRLSGETTLSDSMRGPEAILLPRVSVTPAE